MPPARPRAPDDSRSETSSNIGNIKDRNILNAAIGSGPSKNKRAVITSLNAALMPTINGAAITSAASAEAGQNLPRTDWTTMPSSMLHTYRTTYNLPTASSYTHPHADLIYTSSRTALRAPSSVLARRRLRDLKHQRRKAAALATLSKTANKNITQKEKNLPKPNKEAYPSTTQLKPPTPPLQPHLTSPDGPSSPSSPPPHHQQPSPIASSQIGKQSRSHLASFVRKHFNAQQLSEAETVARFAYVVRQSRSGDGVNVEGSDGDSGGWWMGSQGREVRRGEGGEGGFRLRFRP